MKAIGYVFKVKDSIYADAVAGSDEIPDDWYEYKVIYLDDEGREIDYYNSLFEAYDGIRRLTKEEAEEALKEILEEAV